MTKHTAKILSLTKIKMESIEKLIKNINKKL